VDARPTTFLDLRLVCRGTRSIGYRHQPQPASDDTIPPRAPPWRVLLRVDGLALLPADSGCSTGLQNYRMEWNPKKMQIQLQGTVAEPFGAEVLNISGLPLPIALAFLFGGWVPFLGAQILHTTPAQLSKTKP
jgi:hypothetical protein